MIPLLPHTHTDCPVVGTTIQGKTSLCSRDAGNLPQLSWSPWPRVVVAARCWRLESPSPPFPRRKYSLLSAEKWGSYSSIPSPPSCLLGVSLLLCCQIQGAPESARRTQGKDLILYCAEGLLIAFPEALLFLSFPFLRSLKLPLLCFLPM